MKMQYVKPALYAEKYVLSDHIASCSYVATWGEGDCVYTDTGPSGTVTLFNDKCGMADQWQFAGVEPKFENMSKLDLQCYNTFFDPHNTFFTSM